MRKQIFGLFAAAGLLVSCSGGDEDTNPDGAAGVTPSRVQSDKHPGDMLIDRYMETYRNKDREGYLALLTDDVMTVLYPDFVFGVDRTSMETAVANDFSTRPESYLELPDRFQIAADQWVGLGTNHNGDQTAPMMIIFDLNSDNTNIEATYTHIGVPSFIDGASVTGPTPGMSENLQALLTELRAGSIGNADAIFAQEVALYVYPPTDIGDYGPVITGPSDVASVLNFKWGEGAFIHEGAVRQDTYLSRHMQFVLVGIPGLEGELDRLVFVTFGADPDAVDFEKIIRVDVMGPSGG